MTALTTSPQATAVERWIPRLDDQLLPVLPASTHALERLLKNPDVSLHEIGQVIAADPVMSVHLVRECQRQYGQRAEGALSNIYHCVSMLGLDKLMILLRTFRPLGSQPGDNAAYLRAVGISLHAAEQVRSWARYRSQAGSDQLYMASLLYGVADWSLWHFATVEMRAIDILAEKENVHRPHAEVAVLGCSRDQIALALAQRWQFPPPILAALDSRALPSPCFMLRGARLAERDQHYRLPNRDPQGVQIRSAGLSIRLGHWLAREAARDWYSLQLQRCLSIAAASLNIPLPELRALTQDAAIALSRHWPVPATAAPAANLLWPLQPRRRRRLKLRQLPAAAAKLLGRPMPVTTAPGRIAPVATGKPAPRTIGIPSRNLPQDLDRNAILNAPPPAAPPLQAPRFAGFKSAEAKQQFEQFLQQLVAQPHQFASSDDVLQAVTAQLHATTELARVLAAPYNPRLDQVETLFTQGCDAYPAIQRMKVKLQPVNLFTHLLKQPAGVWISPDRPNPMNGLLPGSFKQASQADEFFLMSVFSQRGPFAVLYADRGQRGRAGLSEHEYRIFKAACSACSKCLIARTRQTGSGTTDP